MKTIALIFLLLLTFSSIAQQKVLVLTNTKSGETEIYQENKRIKIKTLDGEKLKGKFKIVNFHTIEIGENRISLDSIKKNSKQTSDPRNNRKNIHRIGRCIHYSRCCN